MNHYKDNAEVAYEDDLGYDVEARWEERVANEAARAGLSVDEYLQQEEGE